MWDIPRPGIEPVSPALAGRFFITEPPEKHLKVNIINRTLYIIFLLLCLHKPVCMLYHQCYLTSGLATYQVFHEPHKATIGMLDCTALDVLELVILLEPAHLSALTQSPRLLVLG